jgi:hypothetical protein
MLTVKTESVSEAPANPLNQKKIRHVQMTAIVPLMNTANILPGPRLTPTAKASVCPTAPPTTTALLVKNALKDAASLTTTVTQPTTAAIAPAAKCVTVKPVHAVHRQRPATLINNAPAIGFAMPITNALIPTT